MLQYHGATVCVLQGRRRREEVGVAAKGGGEGRLRFSPLLWPAAPPSTYGLN